MCNVLAFLFPQRVRKTAILAGFVPAGLESLVAKRPLVGKPFFVAHGTKDEMVRIDRARQFDRFAGTGRRTGHIL